MPTQEFSLFVFHSPSWWGRNFAMIAGWYFYVTLLAWCLYPLVRGFFPHLRDRGWGAARLGALLLPAWVAWMARGLSGLPLFGYFFGLLDGWGAVVFLAGCGILRGWKERESLRRYIGRRFAYLITAEATFLLAFLLFAGLRSYVPGIDFRVEAHAGEKFTDFAVFNATLRAESFPPEHPWLLGYPLNYYYFGHFLWAFPTDLLGTPPEIGYNQGLCLLFATAGLLIFSALFHLTRKIPWALGGAALILLGGPATTWFRLADALREGLSVSEFLSTYYFWTESRSIGDGTAITEFPYFSFILGDLHAHVSGLLLVLGFVLWMLQFPAYCGRITSGEGSDSVLPAFLRRPIAVWLVPAFLWGAMGATNTWDVISTGVILGVGSFALWRAGRLSIGTLLWFAGGAAAAYLMGHFVLFGAFWRHFESPVTIERAIEGDILPIRLPLVPVAASLRSGFTDFLGFWSVHFCAIGLSGFLLLIWRFLGSKRRPRPSNFIALVLGSTVLFLWVALLFPREDAVLPRSYPGYVASFTFCLAVGWLAAPRSRFRRDSLAIDTLAAGALSLLFLPEILYLDDVFGGKFERINTVFKLYYAAWPILGIAAAGLLAKQARRFGLLASPVARLAVIAPLLGFGAAVILFMAALYPAAATLSRLRGSAVPERPRSLDGWRFVRELGAELQHDYEAIAFLSEEYPSGQYHLIEAFDGTYGYSARFASNLGWPTLLGWKQHIDSWSPEEWDAVLETREELVKQFYSDMTAEEMREFAGRYDIQVVVAGQTEKRLYGDEISHRIRTAFEDWEERRFGDTVVLLRPSLGR